MEIIRYLAAKLMEALINESQDSSSIEIDIEYDNYKMKILLKKEE